MKYDHIEGGRMRKCLFFLFLIIFGCKSNTSITPTPSPTISSADESVLEVATVNWGIAPGVVDLATPRIPAMAEEIIKMRGTDVLCFQELWPLEAKQAAIKALGPDMNIYKVETRGENQRDGVNVCAPSQIQGIAACARKKCANLPTEEQTICVHKECHDDLVSLYFKGGAKCVSCLVASVGQVVDEIVNSCEQPDPHTPVAGVSRAFDGQNGVLLASRWPLKNPEALRLQASFSNRVALLATIEIEGYEPIEVACSHISTANKIPPDNPNFPNWDQEMNSQIDVISTRLKERAGDRPSLFLGDMNAGPALGEMITQYTPKVWRHIMDLGFYSSATDADPPFCSICKDNTLRDVKIVGNRLVTSHNDKNYLIDHVLVRDLPGGTELETVSAHPFLTQVRSFRGYDGQWVERHLSDHCGVVVNFRLWNK